MENDVIVKLDKSVGVMLSANELDGFEKAYALANSMKELKGLLTKEYMAPIMELQGSKIGFVTDKDKQSGYPETVVKDCLIEAVMKGVQPFGNHFNIIAGNCYITKEGFKHLLDSLLKTRDNFSEYMITAQLPRINGNSAAVVMDVEWVINGEKNSKSLDIAVKVNQYMGADAVIGKAERKSRAWLYNKLTGVEITDGDAIDVTFEEVADKKQKTASKTKKAEDGLLEAITPKKEPKQPEEVTDGKLNFE